MTRCASYSTAISIFLCAVLVAADKETDVSTVKVDLAKVKWKVPESIKDLFGYNESDERLFFFANGLGEWMIKIPGDGEYQVIVKASCDSAENEKAKFKLSIADKLIGKETQLTDDVPKEYTLKGSLKGGERKLTIEFTNDVYKAGEFDRNLFIYAVTLKKTK
jgi:mRNA-degrading endonuclease HigB of HigAB toxin-antitoxin module